MTPSEFKNSSPRYQNLVKAALARKLIASRQKEMEKEGIKEQVFARGDGVEVYRSLIQKPKDPPRPKSPHDLEQEERLKLEKELRQVTAEREAEEGTFMKNMLTPTEDPELLEIKKQSREAFEEIIRRKSPRT